MSSIDTRETHESWSIGGYNLENFNLFRTPMHFYMVGYDKKGEIYRVLKISRGSRFELDVYEDPTLYTWRGCWELLQRIDDGNRSRGGRKFITKCYGIVGFIKLSGFYHIMLITGRKKIGNICGHVIYGISESKIIPIPHPSIRPKFRHDCRCKKLLHIIDLTKDFFFSYTYPVMHSLQKNSTVVETGQDSYESIFVWNRFWSQEIREQSTLWTVPLVHGFFKQEELSISGKSFSVVIIARRSRKFAGTRYLKRGVNRKGSAANDVETEQIVFEHVPGGFPSGVSAVVQNRASIPLFWSQETPLLPKKAKITSSMEDPEYKATQLHFQDFVARYGEPIIILNLIRKQEKKPRESILHAAYSEAVAFINKTLDEDKHLKFVELDLNAQFQLVGAEVLTDLNKVAVSAIKDTGIFYCQIPRLKKSESSIKWLSLGLGRGSDKSKTSRLQCGVLRTNCIDCLDRTNVAQYAYGLVALRYQLHALGVTHDPKIGVDGPLGYKLMSIYEAMGDRLALQYGGSAAHNKIFSAIRGQWKAATQFEEYLRSIHRYWSNVFTDAEKQEAIYLFLGRLRSHELWEIDSDDIFRPSLRRSLSDYFHFESRFPMTLDDTKDDSASEDGSSSETPPSEFPMTLDDTKDGSSSETPPSEFPMTLAKDGSSSETTPSEFPMTLDDAKDGNSSKTTPSEFPMTLDDTKDGSSEIRPSENDEPYTRSWHSRSRDAGSFCGTDTEIRRDNDPLNIDPLNMIVSSIGADCHPLMQRGSNQAQIF